MKESKKSFFFMKESNFSMKESNRSFSIFFSIFWIF
jgi:hypothetical protein